MPVLALDPIPEKAEDNQPKFAWRRTKRSASHLKRWNR